jgi:hypothetical protein
MSKDYIVAQNTTLGTVKVWRDLRITPGAVDWRLSRKLLKQFPKRPVEFDVRRR